VNVPLDTPGFATKVWQGTAPAGATAIKVRVIQPRGSADLLVDDASLIRSEPIEVPLTFLSEAPGQLTISNFAASYDLPAPPTALSPPSLPSVQAAGSPLAAVARPTSSSSAATRSTTASSAAVVARVAPAAPSSSSAAAVRVNGPPAAPTERQRGSETELRATDMARAGAQPTAADRALTEVPTIGERRAGHLAAAGITSVAQLARARPQQVMGALGPMSQSRAEALIAEAKRLLEEGGR
jgi:predicted flap endonuclease-1-like 5' DNA nuclease